MIKKLVFRLLCLKVINLPLRGLLKFFPTLLPKRLINRIPVVGNIRLPLPDSEKGLVMVSDGNDAVAAKLYWEGWSGFEPETVELYLHLLKYTGVVVDVGANTGLFALLAAIDDPNRTVHAFEPVPRTFRCFSKNIAVNQLKNLRAMCGAVTNYDGEITLYIPRSVMIPLGASTLKGFREANEVLQVPAVQLDTYVTEHHIPKIDLIKIDTEGTEHEVLAGAKGVLVRDNPLIICEVLKGRTELFLQDILAESAYRFFLITNKRLIHREKIMGDDSYEYRNYLFIPTDKIPKFLENVAISEGRP